MSSSRAAIARIVVLLVPNMIDACSVVSHASSGTSLSVSCSILLSDLHDLGAPLFTEARSSRYFLTRDTDRLLRSPNAAARPVLRADDQGATSTVRRRLTDRRHRGEEGAR